ncbi:unnamed protein product [Orchesella dallaii]|uniref:Fatty acid desaturase domain-containing protein n=1 Tax=Orchesella dallaii TaxID=48710 RepID=A0ABP1S7B2_9HEXA
MSQNQKTSQNQTTEVVWRNVVLMLYIHISGLYGVYLIATGRVYLRTIIFHFITGYLASFGVTAGAHRLWSHRSYKATLPLRILLAILQTMACQNSIHEWCRDHRVHHKFTETNADPHNALRGFFFSHVGWLLVKKHDDVKNKGKSVSLTDLEADPVVMFQQKYFAPLTLFFCFILPWYIPVRLWGEDRWLCWNMVLWRYMILLNFTWCVNSVAHLWGDRPYDKNINPAESKLVSVLTGGEGWHNYHHVFPWDYKAAELPTYGFNWSTGFIDFFAWIGWAYDLKTVSKKRVLQRVNRTGDGSHLMSKMEAETEDSTVENKEIDVVYTRAG